MRILHVCTSDDGGAGKAALRITEACRREGAESNLLVSVSVQGSKLVQSPTQGIMHKAVRKVKQAVDYRLMKAWKIDLPYSLNWLDNESIVKYINNSNADIVNLHWINNSMLSVANIGCIRKPIVWTLHDMWPFTGGCHYAGDCTRYMQQCCSCPEISSAPHMGVDVSNRLFKKKKKVFGHYPLTAVGPSEWITDCAKKSATFQKCKAYTIPNCIDTERYFPIDKLKAREMLRLPQDKPLLLFGAQGGSHDPRKGYDLLMQALNQSSLEDVELVVFGCGEPEEPEDMPYPVHYVGRLHDDISLIMLYNAVDAFIAPSREDNLPNTIMEAMACGTPCVGFRIGGIPDEIDHMVTGYLAEPFDTSDLAKGIETVLENRERMGLDAREKAAREYNMRKVGQQYLDLYEKVLSSCKMMG